MKERVSESAEMAVTKPQKRQRPPKRPVEAELRSQGRGGQRLRDPSPVVRVWPGLSGAVLVIEAVHRWW